MIGAIRKNFHGSYMGNGNYSAGEAAQRIDAKRCDLVSFGRHFISNPDLPMRFLQEVELNAYDEDTFYGGSEKGYTDYPRLV